jgi:hypothetical protein
VLRKLQVLVATLAMTLLLAAPAFAQGQTMSGIGGFNDLNVVTYGGNCLVSDFAEICTSNLGNAGGSGGS